MRTSLESSQSSLTRCPGCGEPVADPPPPQCPLCAFPFQDDRATNEDVTPFAIDYATDKPGWRRMLRWVWFAGSPRLKHLAMMRASAASRRFQNINLLWLAFGMGLMEWTRTGWALTGGPGMSGAVRLARPEGLGWIRVAVSPHDGPMTASPELWWNSAQSLIAVPLSITAALLVLWLLAMLLRIGVSLAHGAAYRQERRMTAALQYGTAWAIPLLMAIGCYLLRPLAYVGVTANWNWTPPGEFFLVVGGGLGGVGLALWWFWLIRLGFTAPAQIRSRVAAFFIFGVPAVAGVVVSGWWLALPLCFQSLFRALGVAA